MTNKKLNNELLKVDIYFTAELLINKFTNNYKVYSSGLIKTRGKVSIRRSINTAVNWGRCSNGEIKRRLCFRLEM